MDIKDIQRIIQFMMFRGCVKDKEFEDMLLSIKKTHLMTKEEVFRLVHDTNVRLKPFNMMIRTCMDKNTVANYYVLISTVANDITRAASHHTPKQFELFRLVFQALVQTNTITDKHFKELAKRIAITISECESLLREWCEKFWLYRTSNKEDQKVITLGVRAMAELDVLMPNHHNELAAE